MFELFVNRKEVARVRSGERCRSPVDFRCERINGDRKRNPSFQGASGRTGSGRRMTAPVRVRHPGGESVCRRSGRYCSLTAAAAWGVIPYVYLRKSKVHIQIPQRKRKAPSILDTCQRVRMRNTVRITSPESIISE